MNRIIAAILFVIIIVLLLSCSASNRAQRHIKRARKLDPSAFVMKRDTTIIFDALEVEPVSTSFKQTGDSVIYITKYDTVTRDSIRIKYLWNTISDTVGIEVDCPDCPQETTIITERETVFIKPTFWQKWGAAIALSVLFLIILYVNRSGFLAAIKQRYAIFATWHGIQQNTTGRTRRQEKGKRKPTKKSMPDQVRLRRGLSQIKREGKPSHREQT